MPRDLTQTVQSAAEMTRIRAIVLASIVFDSGTVNLSNCDRNLVWDGTTYYGVGEMGTVSAVEDVAELQAASIRLTLSGITPEFLPLVLQENYQGRPVTLYLAFLDETYAILDAPFVIFTGMVDQMAATIGDRATIMITAQNEFARWESPRIRRYTNADQRALYPEDTALRFVPEATEREIYWGSAPANSFSQGGGGAPPYTMVPGTSFGGISDSNGDNATGDTTGQGEAGADTSAY
jgi:hypothetical protein